MKRGLLCTLGPILFIVVVFESSHAQVQKMIPPNVSPAPVVGPQNVPPNPVAICPTTAWDQKILPSARFMVLSLWGGAAVLDRETGLVWEKLPSPNNKKWEDARSYCNNLSVGNRMGWRLPTVQELTSLVDPSVSVSAQPKLPLGHPFSNVQSNLYWSGITDSLSTSLVWYVDFGNGRVAIGPKSFYGSVWCVRGGQGVNPQ